MTDIRHIKPWKVILGILGLMCVPYLALVIFGVATYLWGFSPESVVAAVLGLLLFLLFIRSRQATASPPPSLHEDVKRTRRLYLILGTPVFLGIGLAGLAGAASVFSQFPGSILYKSILAAFMFGAGLGALRFASACWKGIRRGPRNPQDAEQKNGGYCR